MGLSQEQREQIRAALGFTNRDSAQPRERTIGTLLADWVDDFDLAPGKWMAGTTSDLYWVFLDWIKRTTPPVPAEALPENGGHWRFIRDLRAAGFGHKATVSGRLKSHLLTEEPARLCLKARADLGVMPNLDWSLKTQPNDCHSQKRRPLEFQDDAYRRRKESIARNRAKNRGKREILARQAIAQGLQLRARGRT